MKELLHLICSLDLAWCKIRKLRTYWVKVTELWTGWNKVVNLV